jgi:hypothetical protein
VTETHLKKRNRPGDKIHTLQPIPAPSFLAMLRILRVGRVSLRRGGLAMTIKEVLVTHAVHCIMARN